MAKIIPLNKKVGQSFQNESEKLIDLLNALPVCIAYFDKEQRYQFNNKTYEEWFGVSLDEIRGKHIKEVLGRKTYESIRGHIEKVLSGEKVTYETELMKKGDATRFVQVILIPHVDNKGAIHGCYAHVSDVSGHRQMEESLKLSSERLRAFMDNSPAFMYIKDKSGKHLYANRFLLKYFNITLDEFIGTDSHVFLPEDVAKKLEEYDRQVIVNGVPIETDELRVTPHGKLLCFREIKFPIKLLSGDVGVGGIVIDITALKEKEENLRKASDEIKLLNKRLEVENVYLRNQLSAQDTHVDIIGKSDAIKYVMYKINQVALSDTTVLILGETGTGKELVAEAIHRESSSRNRPLVIVNCAALPANLIESELFGREKGAFTGSQSRQIGRFDLANKGTVFLDEVGELPLELQAKLLRVIQSGEFERLGSPHTISVDVRIIASTNRDLIKEVKEGRFREDLFYRLNVFPITVPPLRDRKDDIPVLVKHFLHKFEKKIGKQIKRVPYDVIKVLQDYQWPGNVRELENIIERSMVISPNSTLHLADKPETFETAEHGVSQRKSLTDVERDHILQVLEHSRWKIEGKNGAAESLDLNPSTLRTRMRKLDIVKPKVKPKERN